MAVDIGVEATDRSSLYGQEVTRIVTDNPAEIGGIITSIDIWAFTNITGLRVGTFYKTNAHTLKCRDSEAIAGTITAGSKVTKAVTIAVEIGDYIGLYFATGTVERDTAGYDGTWHSAGEYIDPEDEETYSWTNFETFSLGGHIEVPGWTGKISGVTNPAKIMGVAVANIKSVKGVE